MLGSELSSFNRAFLLFVFDASLLSLCSFLLSLSFTWIWSVLVITSVLRFVAQCPFLPDSVLIFTGLLEPPRHVPECSTRLFQPYLPVGQCAHPRMVEGFQKVLAAKCPIRSCHAFRVQDALLTFCFIVLISNLPFQYIYSGCFVIETHRCVSQQMFGIWCIFRHYSSFNRLFDQ